MGVGRRHHLVVTQRAPGLHHGGDPGVGRSVQAVPERKEGVAGARPVDCPTGRLLGSNPAGVPAVLLAGPDSYRTPVLHEHDGVGAHPGDYPPGELQVGPLGSGGFPFGHHPPDGRFGHQVVGRLDQESTVDTPDVQLRPAGGASLQDPQVLPLAEEDQGVWLVGGRHHDLGEYLGQGLGHGRRDRTVHGHHPAEGRHRIAPVGRKVGIGDVGADCRTARVGVLDDHCTRFVTQAVHKPPRRLGVKQVQI